MKIKILLNFSAPFKKVERACSSVINKHCQLHSYYLFKKIGPGSSVGIVTDYGLEGPSSSPGEDEIFRPSRPALWPTQPPVQWVPDLSRR